MATLKRAGAVFVALLMLAMAGTQSAAAAPNNNEIGYRFFVSKGLTPAQSAGLIGNFMHESGDPINPSRHQYGGGPGRGIAQWEGPRLTELHRYAKQRGKRWDDLQLQLDFVWKELNSTERNAYNRLREATTPEDAAYRVRRYYERPSVHADDKRKAYARRIYNQYAGGGAPKPSPVSEPTVVNGPLNLRAQPNSSSAVLTSIPNGAKLNIQCQQKGERVSGNTTTDQWAKVTWNGKTGFASRAYISVPVGFNPKVCGSNNPAPAQAKGEVVGGAVNMRTGTNAQSSVVTTIPQGATVTIHCQQRGQAVSGFYNTDFWARVTYNGKTGFATRAYIKVISGTVVGC